MANEAIQRDSIYVSNLFLDFQCPNVVKQKSIAPDVDRQHP